MATPSGASCKLGSWEAFVSGLPLSAGRWVGGAAKLLEAVPAAHAAGTAEAAEDACEAVLWVWTLLGAARLGSGVEGGLDRRAWGPSCSGTTLGSAGSRSRERAEGTGGGCAEERTGDLWKTSAAKGLLDGVGGLEGTSRELRKAPPGAACLKPRLSAS